MLVRDRDALRPPPGRAVSVVDQGVLADLDPHLRLGRNGEDGRREQADGEEKISHGSTTTTG
jgi:hypothetical protein